MVQVALGPDASGESVRRTALYLALKDTKISPHLCIF